MKVTYKRFLEVVSAPTKQYVRLRLNNTVKPPLLFSEHPDSFILQVLENEYIFFIQDGDVIVNSPVYKESRIIVAETIQDLIKNDNANRTVLQYKAGVGIIALNEIPNVQSREIVDVNTTLLYSMNNLLNLALGHSLPASLIRGPQRHFKVNCFSFNKSKENAKDYLKKVMDNPCIKDSYLLDWCDVKVNTDSQQPMLEEFRGKMYNNRKPNDYDLKWRIWYHPTHGFTFMGSVTDFMDDSTASANIEFELDKTSPFSLTISIQATKKTFVGDLYIDVNKIGLPEPLVKMF